MLGGEGMSSEVNTQPPPDRNPIDYREAPKYLANLLVFIVASIVIFLVISSNLIEIPILNRLYRSSHPLLAIALFVASCSALFGLIARLFYTQGAKIQILGSDFPLIIPQDVAQYFFKVNWWIVLVVCLGTAAYPAFLILRPNCAPPIVVFMLEETNQRFYPRDVISLNQRNAITLRADFTSDIPSGMRCNWSQSGSLIGTSEDNTNCRITVFPRKQTGQEIIVFEAAAPVCLTRTIIPLVLDIQ